MEILNKVCKFLPRTFIKLIKNFGLILICLSGFLYQTTLLLIEYNSGETIVSISILRRINESLPALTLCIPQYLSIEKASKYDPDINQLYTEYKLLLANFNNISLDNKTEDHLANIYSEILNNFNFSEIPARSILMNYSIGTEVFNVIINDDQTLNWDQLGKQVEIVESIYYNWDGNIQKCFTFFSHICAITRKLILQFPNALIKLKASSDWFPLHLSEKSTMYLTIHSPNNIPQVNSYKQILLNFKQSIRILFNRITTELLDSRYDTNCFEYDLDYKFANFNMRSDCLTSCFQKFNLDACQESGLTFTGFPLRKQFLDHLNNSKLATKNFSCQVQKKSDMNLACRTICKHDCSYTLYSIDSIIKDDPVNDTELEIEMWHNAMPDVFLIYLPKTTFLSLVCNFGGLLGMWLGISFINICDKLISLLTRNTNRPNLFLNTQNTIYFNPVNLYVNRNTRMKNLRRIKQIS